MHHNSLFCKSKIEKCKTKHKTFPFDPENALANLTESQQTNKQYSYRKFVEKKCLPHDKYFECSKARKPIALIKQDIKLREKAIRARLIGDKIIHEASHSEEIDLTHVQSLFKLNNLPKKKAENVELKEASPVCSEITFESHKENLDDKKWNFSNPIVLQEQLKIQDDQQLINKKYEYIFKECCKNCCCIFFKSPTDLKQICEDCLRYEKDLYKIPNDLDKYFKAKVVFGTKKIDRESFNVRNRKPLPIACLYVAYAETYETREEYWTEETIDEILEIGKELLDASTDLNYRNHEEDFDIVPVILDKSITLQICPILCYGEGGLAYSDPNIFQSLTCFFIERQACIFHSNDVYLLIWKQCQHFKIFDPNGRKENCERDDKNGFAALIETKHLTDVVHILINLSELNYNDEFKLYEIKINSFRDIETNLSYMEPEPKERKYFRRINNSFVLVPAAAGIDPEKFPNDPNISMFISFIGIVYSYIDPPIYWTRKIVSELITSSIDNYRSYLKMERIKNFNIHNLPKIFTLGTYRILINYCSYFYSGHVDKCLTFKYSSLIKGLEVLFKTEISGLLQIDNSTIAIWYYQGFYFVFDPFQRDRMGRVIIDEENGVGCLQIHTNFDSMCRILYRNSLEMNEDNGNFFIHAIKIESVDVFSINDSSNVTKNYAGVLKFNFPILCECEHANDATSKRKTDMRLGEVPDYCLSLLSISPCKRTCSEREFKLAKRKEKLIKQREERMQIRDSLTSLENEYQMSQYDADEIVENVINIIFCKAIYRIKAKTEKKEIIKAKSAETEGRVKENKNVMISLTSKQNDEDVEEKPIENPNDDEGDENPNDPAIEPGDTTDSIKEITLEEELEKPSNFTSLPDGNWIISGNRILYCRKNKEEQTIAVLASIAANIVSHIYEVSTWNKKILDYIMRSSRDMQTNLQPKNVFLSLLKDKLPNFEINSKTFHVSIKRMKRCKAENLKYILKFFLNRYKSLLIFCANYTGVIFKRNHFFYLFIPYPCDIMGFRSNKSGTACFLRILDLEDLIQRVNFNRFNDSDQTFLILPLNVKMVAEDKPEPTSSDDDKETDIELNDEFLKNEIKKEQDKFTKFKKELARKERKKRKRAGKESNDAENKNERKTKKKKKKRKDKKLKEFEIRPKHIPGTKLTETDPIYEDFKKQLKEPLGYCLCDETKCIFKIQGTFALQNRLKKGDITEIRSCFFTAVYAIMNSIVVPLSEWNFRRVDKCLQNGFEIFDKAEDKTTAIVHHINSIIIDGYRFDVMTEIFKPFKSRPPLDVAVEKISQNRRYFIIQLGNNSLAVHKDKCFHLFDSYPSSEKNSSKKNTKKKNKDEENNEQSKCNQFTDIEVFNDADTAAWILFPDLGTMIKYIGERALSGNWKFDYRIHILKVLSYKKLSNNVELYWQLINVEDLQKDSSEYPDDDDVSCLKPENVEWLKSSVPWSRLSRKICKRYPEIPSKICKNGSYEIEIPNRIYSLWGNAHINLSVIDEYRDEQILAVNVMACCMAHVYRFTEWNSNIIDEIIKNGNKYYQNSVLSIEKDNYRIKLEDLDTEYSMMEHIVNFKIHIEGVFYGKLYSMKRNELNLSRALFYLFKISRYGIIQCANKTLSFGKCPMKGYFLFDCQSEGEPLFEKNQEKAYVLWCKRLNDLIYCIVMTLRIPAQRNVQNFFIYKVDVSVKRTSSIEEVEDGSQSEVKESSKAE